jgi:Leucine-rich repeat (LRR) protein
VDLVLQIVAFVLFVAASPLTPYQMDSLTLVRILELNGIKDSYPNFIHGASLPKSNRITHVYLVRHTISTLNGLKKLDSLQCLYLWSANLASLPSEIPDLKNLKTLNLGWNKLTDLPPGIGRLSHLDTLILDGNMFSRFPTSVCGLKDLTALSLSGNNIDSICPECGRLTKLASFNLAKNPIRQIPECLFGLINLEDLNLSSAMLTALPRQIAELKSLGSLDLEDNRLSEIPEGLFFLDSLTSLELQGNRITALPLSFSGKSQLTSLNIANNLLVSLPQNIVSLKELRFCDFSGNKLQDLPDGWEQMKNLKVINLQNNANPNLGDVFFKRFIANKARCYRDSGEPTTSDRVDTALGFLPLSIGNYWKFSNRKMFRVVAKKIVDGVDCSMLKMFGPSDVVETMLINVDDRGRLFNGTTSPYRYELADFSMKPGESVLGLTKSMGMVWKRNDEAVFLNYDPSGWITQFTFKKGLGFFGNDIEEICINGKVYKFSDTQK